MSVVIYHYSYPLCNSPEERSSQPLRGGSLRHAELQTPWNRGCDVFCLGEWFPTFRRIAVPRSHRTWILNLKQILLGDVASGMLQPLNHFQRLSIYTTHSCYKPCSLRGDRIQWNFPGLTAASGCEGFLTFRELTTSPSSGCALMACCRVNFTFTCTSYIEHFCNKPCAWKCEPLNLKRSGTFRIHGVLMN